MESVGLATPIRDDPTIFWIGAIWATGWNILISYANAKSREHADVSLTQPFQGVTPGLITITALLFHEWPSAIGIVGIIFIAVFTYIHGREGATKLSDWLLPFRALVVLQLPKNFDSLPENERSEVLLKTARQRSGVRWAFVSACAGTMGLMGDGLVSRHGNIAKGLSLQFGVISALNFFAPYLRSAKPEPFFKSGGSLKIFWPLICIFSAGNVISYIVMSSAYRLAPIAYIGSLKRLNIIGVALLAWWFLGEKKGWRLVTALGITTGAILLGLDPGGHAYIIGSAEEYAARIKSVFGF